MIATGNWGTCEWTISDEGEMIIGEGAAESVSADGKYPWDEYRGQIRTCAAFVLCISLHQRQVFSIDNFRIAVPVG